MKNAIVLITIVLSMASCATQNYFNECRETYKYRVYCKANDNIYFTQAIEVDTLSGDSCQVAFVNQHGTRIVLSSEHIIFVENKKDDTWKEAKKDPERNKSNQ